MTNNPPYRTVELTEEQYKFLLDNCDSNLEFGLKSLQTLERRESQEKLIELMEKFKEIRSALKRAV